MNNLVIAQTTSGFFKYPEINFNAESGVCLIKGESFMENSKDFYADINKWMLDFHKTSNDKPIKLIIQLSYFNTSSSKMLYELLKILQEIHDAGQEVTIDWHFSAGDSDLEEDILDLSYDVDLEINQIAE